MEKMEETPSRANGASVGLRKVSPHETAQQRSLSHIRIADQQDFEEDVIVPVSHEMAGSNWCLYS